MKHLVQATGRRKTSTASARLIKGSGVIIINKKELDIYFPLPSHRATIKKPLELTGDTTNYDIHISVKGGGKSGQAGASQHAIARGLNQINPDAHNALKQHKLLTRDSRMKLPKQYARLKSRKKPAFVKR